MPKHMVIELHIKLIPVGKKLTPTFHRKPSPDYLLQIIVSLLISCSMTDNANPTVGYLKPIRL